MKTKMIEIRDRMTFIPAMAIQLEPDDEASRYLLARAGFGTEPDDQRQHVVLLRMTGDVTSQCDPFAWGDRTMRTAHDHIRYHFDELANGAVVDVEYLLGETATPKTSERAL